MFLKLSGRVAPLVLLVVSSVWIAVTILPLCYSLLFPPGATASGRRFNERSLKITNKIEGKVRNNQQIKLSPDLKTLTMTIHVPGRGRPNVLVFDRE